MGVITHPFWTASVKSNMDEQSHYTLFVDGITSSYRNLNAVSVNLG